MPGLEVADQPGAGARRARRRPVAAARPLRARDTDADGGGADARSGVDVADDVGRRTGWSPRPGCAAAATSTRPGRHGDALRAAGRRAGRRPGHLRRRPARPAPPAGDRCSSALRDARRRGRRRRTRRLPFTVHGTGRSAAARSASTRRRPASSSPGCCWPAPGTTRAWTSGTTASARSRRAPHIEMTVAHAARRRRRRSTTPTRTRRRVAVAPGPLRGRDHRRSSPTCPTRRRSWPPPWSPAARSPCRDWPRATTQPGDAAARAAAPRWARRCGSTTRGLTAAPATAGRHRRRPARRRRADPGAGRAGRAGRRAVAPARDRPHPRPRDRPAGARSPAELTGLGADVTETADGLRDPAAPAARRRLPDLRRPPDGARRRGARPGRRRRPGGGRGDHRQDLARLPAAVDGDAGTARPERHAERSAAR